MGAATIRGVVLRAGHYIAALLVAAALLAGCVSVQDYNNPTLPAPQWHLYGGLDIGYAVTLPASWAGFDLNTQVDAAAASCASNDTLKQQQARQITSLHSRGVRLFACDQSRNSDPHVPVAYAVSGQAPADGLDSYLDKLPQAPGREVLERRHLKTNAGDMVLQKVRERLTAQDGSVVDTTQYQFLVIRFNAMHLFFVEFPTAQQDALAKDAEAIGSSFTPVR